MCSFGSRLHREFVLRMDERVGLDGEGNEEQLKHTFQNSSTYQEKDDDVTLQSRSPLHSTTHHPIMPNTQNYQNSTLMSSNLHYHNEATFDTLTIHLSFAHSARQHLKRNSNNCQRMVGGGILLHFQIDHLHNLVITLPPS